MSTLTRNLLNDPELKEFGFRVDKVDPQCVLSLPGYPGFGRQSKDLSRFANHGTISGATWVRQPTGIQVLSFDGTDDRVDFGTPATLRPTNTAFSFEFWLKHTGVAGTERQPLRNGVNWGAFKGMLLYIPSVSQVMTFNLGDGVANTGLTCNAAMTPNWEHWAFTWDLSNMRAYRNGDIQADTPAFAGPIIYDGTVNFLWGGPTGNSFLGLMAQARFYSVALSQKVIKSHYQQEKNLLN
mgnify:CR=1 FL=1